MNSLRGALEQAGINTSSLDRIRLARGFIGKTSYVAAAAILVLGAIAWKLSDPLYLLFIAGAVLVSFALYFVGALWFANKHPGPALLEGAELIQWRRLDIVAKSGTPILGAPVPYKENEPRPVKK